MAECPNCRAIIDELIEKEVRTSITTLSIVDGRLHMDVTETSIDYVEYSCPECDEEITYYVDLVGTVAFLKGGE